MTRETVFPDYDNAPLFDAILARLAPFGFVDSSYGNDACPSMTRELKSDKFISVFVDYVHGTEHNLAPDAPRVYLLEPDAPNPDRGAFMDVESATCAALGLARVHQPGAAGMSLDFGGLGMTYRRACEFLRDLNSAGLLWHMDDSPQGLGHRDDSGDWVDLFSPEQCERLAAAQLAACAFTYGRFEDIHGYCLHVIGQWPEPESGALSLPGFIAHTTGGGCMALAKESDLLQWLVTDESGAYIPDESDSVLLGVYDLVTGGELSMFTFKPGELNAGVFAEIERAFTSKESGN